MNQLERDIPLGDNDSTRRTAHTLKGACGLLGAKRLQELAQEVEDAGRAGSLKATKLTISELENPANQDASDKTLDLLHRLKEESQRVLSAVDELLTRSEEAS